MAQLKSEFSSSALALWHRTRGDVRKQLAIGNSPRHSRFQLNAEHSLLIANCQPLNANCPTQYACLGRFGTLTCE
jgi:hypothetical protein